jgi:hypothetical protein
VNQEYYFAEVEWVKPGNPLASSGDRMLSLNEYDGSGVSLQNAPWVAFQSSIDSGNGSDRYLFESKEKAIAFKRDVETRYAQNPQYLVIDDDGEPVLNEDGETEVAWEPSIAVTRATAEEAQALITAETMVTVSADAIVKRINRFLERENPGELLCIKKTRGFRAKQNLGDFYLLDGRHNSLVDHHLDLNEVAKQYKVLGAVEQVEVIPRH